MKISPPGDRPRLRQLLGRALGAAMLFALALAAALWGAGDKLFMILFDGQASIDRADIGLILLALAALTVISVSVYIQAALGRFAHLLARSLPFLVGSLASAPLALLVFPGRFDLGFLTLYALTLLAVAALHLLSLRKLARA